MIEAQWYFLIVKSPIIDDCTIRKYWSNINVNGFVAAHKISGSLKYMP